MVYLKVDPYLTSNHQGYVTSKTLRHLKLLNKQWISVSFNTTVTLGIAEEKQDGSATVKRQFEKAEEKKKWYVLQITIQGRHDGDAQSENYEDDIVYISPSDLFNLCSCRASAYKKHFDKYIEIVYEKITDLLSMRDKYIASTATVSMVACPYGLIQPETLDDILKEYFEKPKMLIETELFCVTVRSHHTKSLDTPYLIWFRLEKCITKETSHVHQNNSRFVGTDTELILGRNVQSHVPFCPCMVKNRPIMFELYMSKYLSSAYKSYTKLLKDSLSLLQTDRVSTANATILIEAPVGYGKGLILQLFAFQHCIHFIEMDCLEIVGESFAVTEKRLKGIVDDAMKRTPCVVYLKNIHALCKDKEGEKEERRLVSFFSTLLEAIGPQKFPFMVVASTTNVTQMSTRFYSTFMYHLSLDAPSECERESLLNALLNAELVECREVATKTSGFFLSDFIALVRMISRDKDVNGTLSSIVNKETTEMVTIPGLKEKLIEAIDEIRAAKAGTLTNVKVQKVTWSDVGGLEDAKKDIFDTIELPMKFPHLFRKNMRRSGLLFYGAPGCGKTLLAKAIATEFNLNFYSVKGPELINMYVGQSEENVRETFKTARRMAPCVVFFDEIDSLAPNRGRSGDSGGVMDRIVSQLLSELDGMHDNTDVFIIAATNRPDLLDPALLRPGRFDKLVYIGIPEERSERLKLLKAVTRKLQLAPDVSLDTLLDVIPRNLTGADFKALASDAVMCCIKRMIRFHEKDKMLPLNSDEAIVTETDFMEAITNCSPSVSLDELQRYKSIKEEIRRNK